MFVLLEKFDTNPKKQVIMAGDFTLFFDSKLDAQDGNPTVKKKSLAKLVELKEDYDLCDIWRVRNTKSKRFTFAQERSSSKYSSRICKHDTCIDSYFNRSFSCTVLSLKRKRLSQR